jgi:CheY-like chemotaxis protein
LSSPSLELINLQVLVVEDEAITRTALALLLEYQGANVVAVGSAQEGIQVLEDGFQPDILLSNIRLPDGTGASVLRSLRQWDTVRKRQTPAIALTGEALETVRDDPELTGFQLYMSKPFDSQTLVTSIVGLISSSNF